MLTDMRKQFLVNAFTRNGAGGNPAGVVLDAGKLAPRQMQKIAADIHAAETVFVLSSEKADSRLRFFSPVKEVDLCGHATVAAFWLLKQLGHIDAGEYLQQTKVGLLTVRVNADRSIWMSQLSPTFRDDSVDCTELCDAFGIPEEYVMKKSKPQYVSTGGGDIFLAVDKPETLKRVDPDFEKICLITERHQANGIVVFCLDPSDNSDVLTRVFAPIVGIPEESATGTAAGGLACYLYKNNILKQKDYKVWQGDYMELPSEIMINLKVKNEKITNVRVGGRAKFAD